MNDRVSMPTSLTAENGSKTAMSGEFAEHVVVDCQLCDNGLIDDEICDDCDGTGNFGIDVPVEWSTIKAIYKRAVHYHGKPLPPAPEEE